MHTNYQSDSQGGTQGSKPKIEYFVDLNEETGNGEGDQQKVRAHYFLVSSNGDLIFFIVSPKFGDKKAISAFASGTWSRVRENWTGPQDQDAKSLSNVNFFRNGGGRRR